MSVLHTNVCPGSKEDIASIEQYQSYDQCVSVTNFLLCIIGCLFNKDPWEIKISDYVGDKLKDLDPTVIHIIRRYSPIASLITAFFENMQKVSKSTPYPYEELTKVLAAIDQGHENEFKIFSATDKESAYIINKIIDFNNAQIAFTQNPEQIHLNFVVKNHTGIIAGINAYMYHWGLLCVDVLFVEENYRGNDFGSKLLQMVEDKAKSMGATIVHLETFDFQAKDFYLKHGYTIFGVLDDCPEGHKSYSLFKKLQLETL